VSDEEPIATVPVVYTDMEEVPIVFANQFIIQHQQDEFILTMGQLQPPLLLGSPEDRMEQVKKLTYVPVKVVAKFGFTRERLTELIKALQTNLRIYDEKKERESK